MDKKLLGRIFTAISVVAIVGLGFLVTIAEAEVPTASALPPPNFGKTPAGNPNIIFITVDTLRADRIGPYGYEKAKTPALDKFATESVKFEYATVPFPRTTPSMASLFTGLWPLHHGSREVWSPIKQGEKLAVIMRDLGYDTLGVTSNGACDKKQGFDEGFRKFAGRKQLKGISAKTVTDKALKFVNKRKKKKPLFLWVHYVDPHWPYAPPKGFEDQPEATKCRKLKRTDDGKKLGGGQILANHNGIAEAAWEDCSALYDASVSYADQEIGRLISDLKGQGLYKKAIVVFTSDHGENMGEDGYWFGHGPSTHEAAMRVPLMVRAPGLPRGKTDYGVTRIEDVMPTVLELSSVPREDWPEMDGVSFAWRVSPKNDLPAKKVTAAFIEAGTPLKARANTFIVSGRRRGDYCYNGDQYSLCSFKDDGDRTTKFFDHEADPNLENPLEPEAIPADLLAELEEAKRVWVAETARQRAIREKQWKLLERPQLDGSYARELYDLVNDPLQTEDVIEEYPDQGGRLGDALDRWVQDLPVFEGQEKLSEDDLAELRALGYIR